MVLKTEVDDLSYGCLLLSQSGNLERPVEMTSLRGTAGVCDTTQAAFIYTLHENPIVGQLQGEILLVFVETMGSAFSRINDVLAIPFELCSDRRISRLLHKP